jgi:tetratricopeptide (TPR) repeat protein
MPRKLRIFISSPGDVGQERVIAARLLERLQGEFANAIELEPILWEHEPLRASAHFQEQIVPPSQTDIVICILWSRLGTRLPEQFHREDGSLYSSGTEWEFEDALKSFRERGIPDLMVYRKTAEPQASMSDEEVLLQRLQQKKALDAFIDHWFGNPTDSFRFAFHTFDSPDKFETLLETHLRKLIQERLPERQAEMAEGPVVTQWLKGSPFRGLFAFDVEHAPVFFGRTRAISGIKEALIRQAENGCAFVLVFGMSGCGKSSLVRAGALPTLIQPGVIEGIGLWRWCIFRPSDAPDDPLLGLSYALLKCALPEMSDLGLDAYDLASLFRQAPDRAIRLISQGLKRAGEETAKEENLYKTPVSRLAIVVDQMEEMFTLSNVDDAQREGFVAALSALARCGDAWIMATMRSDFFPRCREIPELVALKEGAGQYDTLPPNFTEIGQMIRYPARAAGLRFEVDPETGVRLDERLHEAAARDPEALPLLSFTLDELFKRRSESGVLTFDAYEKLGGLEGALAQRAEEVFASLDPAVQASLPSALSDLVAISGSSEIVTSRRAPLSSVAGTPEAKKLVDAFIDARLLVADRADDGQSVVRVAHEALLSRWPRIQEWAEENLAFLHQRERVAVSARRWMEEKKSPDFHLSAGKPLADAWELLQRRRSDLDPLVIEYVEASQRSATRKRRQRLAWIAGALGSFIGVTLVFGLFSYGQWRRTEKEKRLALTAVQRLTYDIPKRLIDLPGSRSALRTIFTENLGLLDQLSDARAKPEKRANFVYMGDMWMMLGDTAQAMGAYQSGLSLARSLAANPSDSAARWDLAVTLAKVGDVYLERTEAKKALDLYRESVRILESLPGRANARLQRDRSAGYQKIGDALLAQNDLPGALAAYQKDFGIAEALSKAEPKDRSATQDLIDSQTKIGDARLAGGDAPGALSAYARCLSLLRGLDRTGANVAIGRELAANYCRIGDVYLSMKDADRAKRSYLDGMRIARKQAKDKTNARAQRDLWVCYSKMGDLYQAQGDAARALDAYQTGLSIARDLASDKSDGGAQSDLRLNYEKIRDLDFQLGREREAYLAHEQSLEAGLNLLPGADPDSLREKADLRREIGLTRMERKDYADALTAYRSALETMQKLAETDGDSQTTRDLATAYDNVAYAELLNRRPQEALAVASEGASVDPDQARLKATLAHCYLLNGEYEQARKLYMENRTRKIDERQTFANAALEDFKTFRSVGIRSPEMDRIEKLLSGSL